MSSLDSTAKSSDLKVADLESKAASAVADLMPVSVISLRGSNVEMEFSFSLTQE